VTRPWWLSAPVLGLSLVGCLFEVPEENVPEPCEIAACSSNASCQAGDCTCLEGYDGNAYAVDGCQPKSAGRSCADGCGAHAWCDDGACQCDSGYVAACGDGTCLATAYLCDGKEDCGDGRDEEAEVCLDPIVQEWVIVDACDDDLDIEWRVWALERDWVWPAIDDTFTTWGLDHVSREPLECIEGELLCFGGGIVGGHSWGVGLDGLGECDDCCAACGDDGDVIELAPLRCE